MDERRGSLSDVAKLIVKTASQEHVTEQLSQLAAQNAALMERLQEQQSTMLSLKETIGRHDAGIETLRSKQAITSRVVKDAGLLRPEAGSQEAEVEAQLDESGALHNMYSFSMREIIEPETPLQACIVHARCTTCTRARVELCVAPVCRRCEPSWRWRCSPGVCHSASSPTQLLL